MVILLVTLWIGSAVAGWFLFWPWLIIPIVVVGLYAMRVTSGFSAARERNGLPVGTGSAGTSMIAPHTRLLMVTAVQHVAIFGIAAVIGWILHN